MAVFPDCFFGVECSVHCSFKRALASPHAHSLSLAVMSQAPAAFGLVSFLMHAGFERKQIQKHLLAFSAAAPVLAISTYFILTAVRPIPLVLVIRSGRSILRVSDLLWCCAVYVAAHNAVFVFVLQTGGSSRHHLSATGIGMLFSAGTFLYVATVHVLPEISNRGQQRGPPHTRTGSYQHGGGLGVMESLTLILGAGLPVLLALGLHDDWCLHKAKLTLHTECSICFKSLCIWCGVSVNTKCKKRLSARSSRSIIFYILPELGCSLDEREHDLKCAIHGITILIAVY